jgi:SAM-dependent methyltransferase
MNPEDHWNSIYRTQGEDAVSWFEALASVSLELLDAAGLTTDTCVVDVGGGESRLVDALLAKGLDCLAVLDVSGEALHHAQARIGGAAPTVTWIEADVTDAWSLKPMDIWHDRAGFHFLTDGAARANYRQHILETLKADGSVIIATFAPDGPERCSGLPVVRYSPELLAKELGVGFALQEWRPHRHVTPWGGVQSFQYSRFRRVH